MWSGPSGDALGDGVEDLVVDEDALGELLTAVENTVTDGADFLQARDDAVFLACQLLDDGVDRFRVGRELYQFLELRFPVHGRMFELAAFDADALAHALCNDSFRVHIKKLIFQGRAAGVDD